MFGRYPKGAWGAVPPKPIKTIGGSQGGISPLRVRTIKQSVIPADETSGFPPLPPAIQTYFFISRRIELTSASSVGSLLISFSAAFRLLTTVEWSRLPKMSPMALLESPST